VQDKGILYEEAFFAFHSSRVNIDLPFSISTLDSAIKLKNLTSQSEVIDQKINEHPYFKKEKPETLLIDEIEMIWSSISEKDDWSLFYDKLQRLRSFRGCYKL
jgi:hypothetical protein